ncbi:hypothetical protein LINGRAHAP2_LOCUS31801 [Linum grandiflorum]
MKKLRDVTKKRDDVESNSKELETRIRRYLQKHRKQYSNAWNDSLPLLEDKLRVARNQKMERDRESHDFIWGPGGRT